MGKLRGTLGATTLAILAPGLALAAEHPLDPLDPLSAEEIGTATAAFKAKVVSANIQHAPPAASGGHAGDADDLARIQAAPARLLRPTRRPTFGPGSQRSNGARSSG
jgi:hypothetical protein